MNTNADTIDNWCIRDKVPPPQLRRIDVTYQSKPVMELLIKPEERSKPSPTALEEMNMRETVTGIYEGVNDIYDPKNKRFLTPLEAQELRLADYERTFEIN